MRVLALLTLLLVDPLIASHMARAAERPIEAFRPAGDGEFDHGAFDAFLKRHVKPDGEGYNRFNYAAAKNDRTALTAYLDAVQRAKPSGFSRDAAHAYWINLYNAKTLDVVLEAYPVSSIRRINLGGGLFAIGPWKKDVLAVEGQSLSLDDVEHRIVRAIFEDPMSHYGLNCASYSCPNLLQDAYTAANVDAQLEASARAYVAHPRGVKVEDGRITASKIYKWYAADFGGEAKLKDHWTGLATPEKAEAIRGATIDRYGYDWDLNAPK